MITDNHLGDWGTQFGMILWGWKHCLDASAYELNPTQELGRLYRLVRKVVDADPQEIANDSIAAGLVENYPDARPKNLETVKLHEVILRIPDFGNNLCQSVVKKLSGFIAV